MKLILIHGRAQEQFEEVALKKEWLLSLNLGLHKSGLALPDDVIIEFPYYGKYLKELVDKSRLVPDPKEIRRSGSNMANESGKIEFFEAYLGEIALGTATTREEHAILGELLQRKRGVLNWDTVQNILAYLDEKQILGESLMKMLTLDVFLYLTVPEIKRQINEYVEKSFDSEPCVVVGHSLGSIVSYLVLKNNPQFKVQKFITLGSPLGMMSVYNYLEPPLRMPKCVNVGSENNGWFNAYDDRDFVAINPLDKKHFNIYPSIENKNDVNNQTDNRHGIVGYLNDAVVARKIFEALTQ